MPSMSSVRNFLPIILLLSSLTSCMITNSVRTAQIEIMKPAIIDIPENYQNVAIFNRDIFQSDTCIFKYFKGPRLASDTNIRYHDLSKTCTNALTSFLREKDYFQRITNYSDSLKDLLKEPEILAHPYDLLKKTNSDICIFLDYFHFHRTYLDDFNSSARIRSALFWTIAIKTDTAAYIYLQADTLIYEEPPIGIHSKDKGTKAILMEVSENLGRFFGAKIIPAWIPVERMYYKSNNHEMLQAEQYAHNNDWIKAAEIWNKETINKNRKIVAKACFNMALACEMEGEMDEAIDWLNKSSPVLSENNAEHKANCKRYIDILVMRKKEMERLGKQVRNPEINSKN